MMNINWFQNRLKERKVFWITKCRSKAPKEGRVSGYIIMVPYVERTIDALYSQTPEPLSCRRLRHPWDSTYFFSRISPGPWICPEFNSIALYFIFPSCTIGTHRHSHLPGVCVLQ